MPNLAIDIAIAESPADLQAVRTLLEAYAESQPDELCFAGFAEELAGLPGAYAPPAGQLFLARSEQEALGCVGLISAHQGCEMRRLYVAPKARRSGLGQRMVQQVMEAAKKIGYRRMILSTRPHMEDAMRLYLSLGYRTVPPPPGESPGELIWMAMDLVRRRVRKPTLQGPKKGRR